MPKLKPPSTYSTSEAMGVKSVMGHHFLQNEFLTDARRGAELAGDGHTDKEVGTGPVVVSSPLEVTP